MFAMLRNLNMRPKMGQRTSELSRCFPFVLDRSLGNFSRAADCENTPPIGSGVDRTKVLAEAFDAVEFGDIEPSICILFRRTFVCYKYAV
jgi:hypothetical protein